MGRAVLRQLEVASVGGAPSVAAISVRSLSGALKVWGSFGLLMILVAAPLSSTVLPPLFDYPNHLARMHLLEEGGNVFYAVHWAPLPNLAQDLIVPALGRLVPLEVASKLFVVMIFGLIAGGSIWLNRIATGAWRLWPLLAFALLYNRSFLWGFLNYLFGVGIGLVGAALWLALERQSAWLRILVSSLVALACYFSHIAAFGFYVLVILGIEVSPAWADLRGACWPSLQGRIIVAGAQFIAPATLFLCYWQRSGSGEVNYAAVWRKADLLFSVFDNYSRIFDIACFALFLALLGWLGGTRRLRVVPRLSRAVYVVGSAYFFLPSQVLGGSGLDHRLPVALFLLLIAAAAPRFPSRRAAIAIGITAATVLIVRLAVIEHVWRDADGIYSADLIGLDRLPRGAKVALAIPPDAIHLVPVPEVHLATLAVARREAFVPTIFAYAGQQPLAFTRSYAALADAATPQRFWAALAGGAATEMEALLPVLQRYDYVVVTGGVVSVRPTPCLGPFFQRASFQILAVLHHPDCMMPEN